MKLFAGTIGAKRERVVPDADDLRAARLAAARKARWTELDTDELEEQRFGFVVDRSTGVTYKPHAAAVFERGSARIIPDQAPLHFTVGVDGAVRVFESYS